MAEEYLILDVEEKPFISKEGNFLQFRLANRNQTITGIKWDASLGFVPKKGMVVSIDGAIREHPEFGTQLIINAIEQSGTDITDLLPASPRDYQTMLQELHQLTIDVSNPLLTALLQSVMDDKDFMGRFTKAPASLQYHYSYVGGLLEQTLNITRQCVVVGEQQNLDCDLLRAGAILSGAGKALAYDLDGIPELSEEGGLLGNAVLADRFLQKHMPRMPRELALKLHHMVVARKAKFPEAAVLISVRSSDVQINDFIRAYNNQKGEGWGYDRRLGYLYLK
ncbi:MAG: hypothetical protein ACQESG_08120 [Nanobdellota archaeon]